MSLADVQKTFDDWAPFYNPTHGWMPGRRGARQALGLRPGDRVLDLACGTGLNFRHLRQLVGETGQVIGVDLSPGMLEVGHRLIAEQGWDNVEVRQADAARLPFGEGSFDRAICSYALNIIPDYRRAIREVWRVLGPGGRFVSLETRTAMHSLARLWHVCAVDLSHDSVGELEAVFRSVRMRRAWMGMIVLAMADK